MAIVKRTIETYAVRCNGCGIESVRSTDGETARMIAARGGWKHLEWCNGLEYVYTDLCAKCAETARYEEELARGATDITNSD